MLYLYVHGNETHVSMHYTEVHMFIKLDLAEIGIRKSENKVLYHEKYLNTFWSRHKLTLLWTEERYCHWCGWVWGWVCSGVHHTVHNLRLICLRQCFSLERSCRPIWGKMILVFYRNLLFAIEIAPIYERTESFWVNPSILFNCMASTVEIIIISWNINGNISIISFWKFVWPPCCDALLFKQ